ncbi:hypothetical protein DFH11DRAFT_1732743 [Phellopilus nigrolimitatus]|nr:hypothetical protein DFH11DRAFT_1732743 [Phellopilus nigrolimitatus]
MSTTPGAANNNTEGHELETALATIQEAIQAVISHTLIRAEEIGLTEAEMRAYLTLGKSLCKVPNNLVEDLFCACRGCAAEEDEEEVVLVRRCPTYRLQRTLNHYIQGQYYFGRLRTPSVCGRGNVEKFMGQGKGKDSVGGSAN